jgi:hypothetical protein
MGYHCGLFFSFLVSGVVAWGADIEVSWVQKVYRTLTLRSDIDDGVPSAVVVEVFVGSASTLDLEFSESAVVTKVLADVANDTATVVEQDTVTRVFVAFAALGAWFILAVDAV